MIGRHGNSPVLPSQAQLPEELRGLAAPAKRIKDARRQRARSRITGGFVVRAASATAPFASEPEAMRSSTGSEKSMPAWSSSHVCAWPASAAPEEQPPFARSRPDRTHPRKRNVCRAKLTAVPRRMRACARCSETRRITRFAQAASCSPQFELGHAASKRTSSRTENGPLSNGATRKAFAGVDSSTSSKGTSFSA